MPPLPLPLLLLLPLLKAENERQSIPLSIPQPGAQPHLRAASSLQWRLPSAKNTFTCHEPQGEGRGSHQW